MRIPVGVVGIALVLSLVSLAAQVRSPYSEGAAGLIQKLERLDDHRQRDAHRGASRR